MDGRSAVAVLAVGMSERAGLLPPGATASVARDDLGGLTSACARLRETTQVALAPGLGGRSLGALAAALDAWPLGDEPVEALGRAHQQSFAHDKELGAFYTPEPVVLDLVTAVLRRLDASATVVDPACGPGAFLLAALRFLAARVGWRVAASQLHGVDVDPFAVELARLSLRVELARAGVPGGVDLGPNVVVGDALVDAGGPSELAFDWRQRFPRIFEAGGFDAVVGNPPYLSFGGRERARLSPELASWLQARYASSGWRSSHALFVERAARELAKRCVGFVVPDQVGHLEGYRPIRQMLAREGGVVEVRYLGEGVFEGAVTPALAFVWDREHRGPATIIEADGARQSLPQSAGRPWGTSSEQELLEKLRLGALTLRPCLHDCGIRTTCAAEQVVPVARATGLFVPVLEGRLVTRYQTSEPTSAVRLDSGLALHRSRDELLERIQFVIRQTAAYPIVGPRAHVLHFRNSLLGLSAPAELDVRYVVALLNSKLLRFAYVEAVREARQRVFPQVKLAALAALPIRRAEAPTVRRVVELVDALLAGAAPQADLELDALVYGIYGLNEREIATVERRVAGLRPPPAGRADAGAPAQRPKRAALARRKLR